MPLRLADRLNKAREQRFVGRGDELALFEVALAAPEPPFCVLHLFGPGGVGKTALLRQYAAYCERAGIPACYIDGRNVEPAPEAFLGALQRALGLVPPETPLQALAERQRRQVLLIDTYETLAPLDNWLRDTFLPQLPEQALVVLAGRQPPALEWRGDPGWQSVVRVAPLRNLSPEESRAYLHGREVPPDQHGAVLDFTHGHPLALSLVADVFAQRRGVRFQPEVTPDIVKALLGQLVQKVPGPAHRAALESCALVRLTTEALLAEMLAVPDAHELFEWLRGLSFIEPGPLGLFPHDLAREALTADLRWRNPDWYAELHRRARNYYAARLAQTHGFEQQRVLFEYIYLHRDNPIMRPYLEWQESGSTLPDVLRSDDTSELIELVAEHEGHDAACVAAFWFARQPGAVTIFRDPEGRPAGFITAIALHEATTDDLAHDPVAADCWRYLAARAPLRPGERATLFRFWMARDGYQAVSAMQSLIFGNVAQHYLTTPGLAFSFFPIADPEFWAPLFAHIDLARVPALDFAAGGRHYGVFTHDWRVVPPLAWLALLAEREIDDSPQPAAPPPAAAPLVVLSEPAFADAVHDALRGFVRPDGLRGNPLLQSRLVVERTGGAGGEAERIVALQALLRETVEALRAAPRDLKLYRALHHTYLHPAPTQERAAELLDLPFSTFRRHLKTGVKRVAEILWRQDIGAGAK